VREPVIQKVGLRAEAGIPYINSFGAFNCKLSSLNEAQYNQVVARGYSHVANGVMRARASSDARHVFASKASRGRPGWHNGHVHTSKWCQRRSAAEHQAALVQVVWQQRSFVVHLPDLLDAFRIEDVGEIAWPEGLRSTSAGAK